MGFKRILIVDDEESFRHMLSVILIKEGYEVETSSNGEEGLQKATASAFDHILCDVRMPRMDGLAFLREIKKNRDGNDDHRDVGLRNDGYCN